MTSINTARNLYRAYHRLHRLIERRETGYDPEDGIFVNLRNDGVIHRLGHIPDGSPWHSHDAFLRDKDIHRHAENVVSNFGRDPLPARFGTVIEVGQRIADSRKPEQVEFFGPTEPIAVYRDVRAHIPQEMRPLSDHDALLTMCNREIESLMSRLEQQYWPPCNYEDIAARITAASSELSRRCNLHAPIADVFADLVDI